MFRLNQFAHAVLVILLMFATLGFGGCMGLFVDKLTCDEYPFTLSVGSDEDWREKAREVKEHIADKWGVYLEGGEEYQTIAVTSWRTSNPEDLREQAKRFDGSYLDWDKYPAKNRPSIIDDLLCRSEWREENIPSLTSQPYTTSTGTSVSMAEDVIRDVEEEFRRQTGAKSAEGAFIRWRGAFYGVGLMHAVGTPSPN